MRQLTIDSILCEKWWKVSRKDKVQKHKNYQMTWHTEGSSRAFNISEKNTADSKESRKFIHWCRFWSFTKESSESRLNDVSNEMKEENGARRFSNWFSTIRIAILKLVWLEWRRCDGPIRQSLFMLIDLRQKGQTYHLHYLWYVVKLCVVCEQESADSCDASLVFQSIN